MPKDIDKILKEFWTKLSETSTALKYSGKTYYKTRILDRLKELYGIYKELRNELKDTENEHLKKIIQRLDKDIKKICDKKKSPKYRYQIIEDIKSDRLDVDIKLELENIFQVPVEFKKIANSLGKEFKRNFKDLSFVYGESGTLTAFMLRKILEKAIFLAFAKNGLVDKLKENNRILGLEKMLDKAPNNQINGHPILTSKVASNLKKVKFLGDKAAHHPFVEVDMEEIIPQLPFFQTAFQELARHIK